MYKTNFALFIIHFNRTNKKMFISFTNLSIFFTFSSTIEADDKCLVYSIITSSLFFSLSFILYFSPPTCNMFFFFLYNQNRMVNYISEMTTRSNIQTHAFVSYSIDIMIILNNFFLLSWDITFKLTIKC